MRELRESGSTIDAQDVGRDERGASRVARAGGVRARARADRRERTFALQVGALAPRYVMPLFDLRAFATLYSPRDAARALDCFVADGYKALYR